MADRQKRFYVLCKKKATSEQFKEAVEHFARLNVGPGNFTVESFECVESLKLHLGMTCITCVKHDNPTGEVKRIDAILTDYFDIPEIHEDNEGIVVEYYEEILLERFLSGNINEEDTEEFISNLIGRINA